MVDRLIRWSDSTTRAWTYPVIAFVLALGAPAGLILLRSALAETSPDVRWLALELREHREFYLYVTISTTVAFTILGWITGSMYETLRRLSITDPLTGVHNRRHLHAQVLAEVARSARYANPVSLLIVDVDGLKAINDASGHKAGDRAIATVARALESSCRSTDTVARLGGDEFAILAPATTAHDALELALRVRANLRANGDAPTVSIGIADLDRAGEHAPDALYAAADAALYDAKAAGRDRAVLAPHAEGEVPVVAKHASLGRAPFAALSRAPSGAWNVASFRRRR